MEPLGITIIGVVPQLQAFPEEPHQALRGKNQREYGESSPMVLSGGKKTTIAETSQTHLPDGTKDSIFRGIYCQTETLQLKEENSFYPQLPKKETLNL